MQYPTSPYYPLDCTPLLHAALMARLSQYHPALEGSMVNTRRGHQAQLALFFTKLARSAGNERTAVALITRQRKP